MVVRNGQPRIRLQPRKLLPAFPGGRTARYHQLGHVGDCRDGMAKAFSTAQRRRNVSRIVETHEVNRMRSIPLGVQGSFALVVGPEHLANAFKDAMLPPVLATPVMIMVMENAALNAIKAYLEVGESAVGTRVDVAHLAATPVGRRITGHAEVAHVEGRRIEFKIRATDGNDEIGVGTHDRMVINLAKFSEHLKARAG
jgi:fluoroacetyl-CoA thioesterase